MFRINLVIGPLQMDANSFHSLLFKNSNFLMTLIAIYKKGEINHEKDALLVPRII